MGVSVRKNVYNEEPREPHRTKTSIFQRQKTCHYIYSRDTHLFLLFGKSSVRSRLLSQCQVQCNERSSNFSFYSFKYVSIGFHGKSLELEVGSGQKRSPRFRPLPTSSSNVAQGFWVFLGCFVITEMCFISNES